MARTVIKQVEYVPRRKKGPAAEYRNLLQKQKIKFTETVVKMSDISIKDFAMMQDIELVSIFEFDNDVLSPSVMTEAPPAQLFSMTPKAGVFTYVQMIEAGWTDELLVEHGYMTDDIPF